MPAWVEIAVGEYKKRLQGEITLQVIEIPTAKRGKSSSVSKLVEQEGVQFWLLAPKVLSWFLWMYWVNRLVLKI